jgi:predicted lysophospholipase L1 biosynthesis ABC-type transport system permease subunit
MFRCIGLAVLCLSIAASALVSESDRGPKGLQFANGVRVENEATKGDGVIQPGSNLVSESTDSDVNPPVARPSSN